MWSLKINGDVAEWTKHKLLYVLSEAKRKRTTNSDTVPKDDNFILETWLSGRKRLTANEVARKKAPGFESLRLRRVVIARDT